MDIKARMNPPPIFSPWDEKDEAKLDGLWKMQVKFEDTALGHQRVYLYCALSPFI